MATSKQTLGRRHNAQYDKYFVHLFSPSPPSRAKIEYWTPPNEAEERHAKKQRKQVHKLQLAAVAKAEIANHEAAGRILVYTDGSAEWVAGVGWIGGWGCYGPQGWESAAHLPPHTRQTVNRAELRAGLEMHCGRQSVQVPPPPLVIATPL